MTDKDDLYGWVFGCDEFVNASEAAVLLKLHTSYVCELLRELESISDRKPTDRTYPLRAGRPDTIKDSRRKRSGTQWRVCVRSIHEYAKRRKPVEV